VWARGNADIAVGSIQVGRDMLSNFRGDMGITANLPGTTIMRTRLQVGYQTAAATRDVSSGLFVGMVLDEIGALAANLPNRTNARGSDFMIYTWFPYNLISLTGTTSVNNNAFVLDVPTRRKMEEISQTPYLVFEPTQTSDTWAGHLEWQILLALP
jgi:hypothetical protein